MRIRVTLMTVSIFVSAIISLLLILANWRNIPDGYGLIVLFPLIYIFVFIIWFKIGHSKVKLPITLSGYLILQWLRFVALPPLIALSGENAGSSYINPDPETIFLATFIMMFEFVIGASFLKFLLLKEKIKEPSAKRSLAGNKGIYLVFIVFAMAIFIYFQSQMNLVNFILVSVGTGARIGDHTTPILVLVQQILIVAMIIIFVWTLDYCRKKYDVTGKNIYVNIPLIVALINVCIIIGERRSAQIFAAFCSIVLLITAFPKQKRKILWIIGGVASSVIGLMSIYKFSYAFLYDSYAQALQNSSFDISTTAQMLQSYFVGPEIVAKTIEFSRNVDLNILNISFDFLRSIFPLSLLLKDNGDVTSVVFNNYIYSGSQSTGHVLSSVGYGYIYFGILLSPIIILLNIFIATKLEKMMYESYSYEMMYIWGYLLIRFVANLVANTPALISPMTIMLFTGGMLVVMARLFKFSKKIIRNKNFDSKFSARGEQL